MTNDDEDVNLEVTMQKWASGKDAIDSIKDTWKHYIKHEFRNLFQSSPC